MTTFNYTGKDKAGNTVSGQVEALDERAAAASIRERGHLPMNIVCAGEAHAASQTRTGSVVAQRLIYPLWTGVNIRHLVFFYRQMATMLAAGMSLAEALRSVKSRAGGSLGRIIGEAYDTVSQGGLLSSALGCYPRVFSPLQLSLIRAGEAGGLLEQMIDRIAGYLEHEIAIRRMVMKLLFYPCLIFVGIILIPHLPKLVLAGFMPFVNGVWMSVGPWLPWLIAGVVVLKLLMQFESCRLIWDYVKIQPPILGTMARKIAMSRFGRSLAVLYSAGMPMSDAIAIGSDACANVAISRGIKRAIPAIQSGEGLTESLSRTGMVMPIVMDMLATGEKTGSMDNVLEKAADYMDEEVDVTIHKTGILMFVLSIVVAGWIVLQMLLAFYGGYIGGVMEQGR